MNWHHQVVVALLSIADPIINSTDNQLYQQSKHSSNQSTPSPKKRVVLVAGDSPTSAPSILCHLPTLGKYSPAIGKLKPKQLQANSGHNTADDSGEQHRPVVVSELTLSKAETSDEELSTKEHQADDENSLVGTEDQIDDEKTALLEQKRRL